MENNHPIVSFKVQDYTTELVGRYDEDNMLFYLQRGDGEIVYRYEEYRVTEYTYLVPKRKIIIYPNDAPAILEPVSDEVQKITQDIDKQCIKLLRKHRYKVRYKIKSRFNR